MDLHRMRRVLPVLKVLETMSSEDRIKILPHLEHLVHDGINECIYNATCNKHIPMEMKKIIKKHTMKDAETYKYLLKPNITSRKRHAKLQEIGGSGLGLILRAVVPVLDKVTQKGQGSNKKIKIEENNIEEEDSDEEEESEEETEDSEEEEEDTEEEETSESEEED